MACLGPAVPGNSDYGLPVCLDRLLPVASGGISPTAALPCWRKCPVSSDIVVASVANLPEYLPATSSILSLSHSILKPHLARTHPPESPSRAPQSSLVVPNTPSARRRTHTPSSPPTKRPAGYGIQLGLSRKLELDPTPAEGIREYSSLPPRPVSRTSPHSLPLRATTHNPVTPGTGV